METPTATRRAPFGLLSEVQWISLGGIDIGDERFRISSGPPGQELVDSIGRLGCLTPPICVPASGRMVPVGGFRRLVALRTLRKDDRPIEVRLLPETATPLEILTVAVWDARRDDEVSPFMVARAAQRGLDLGIGAAILAQELLGELGQQNHPSVLQRHLKLFRIPSPLFEVLESLKVSLRRALSFVDLDTDVACLLAQLAGSFRLNGRALEEWSRMIGQVAQRDGLSWTEVVGQARIPDLIEDVDRQLDQRAQEARERLWNLRYPVWRQTREVAMQKAEAVDLPLRARIVWDSDFEADGFTLTISVRDTAELGDDLNALLEGGRLARIGALLEVL